MVLVVMAPALLCALFMVCGVDDAGRLKSARDHLRRGLLSEAERDLAQLSEEAMPRERAWAELIRGNVAYERADLAAASVCWSRAKVLFDEASDMQGVAAAGENLGMVHARLARRHKLETARSRLTILLCAALAAAAGLVLVLARRT